MTWVYEENVSGLSPRVRGNPALILDCCAMSRSIPACAGEPHTCIPIYIHYRVYPRVCGGTEANIATADRFQGLSPRVRGNHTIMGDLFSPERSIPACAGEPFGYAAIVIAEKVYPRVCGGTHAFQAGIDSFVGLSPRVRGNHTEEPYNWTVTRSIPACAGEPFGYAAIVIAEKVYPRVCGGTHAFQAGIDSFVGLSPRVRGNLAAYVASVVSKRSIPACAGEPLTGIVTLLLWRVYPRVCGGTQDRVGDRWLDYGLSPRVRGNPPPVAADSVKVRSIPACAGEP